MAMTVFYPPLSTQRYCWVQDFVSQDPTIKTLTDVGCAQGRMLIWLKHIPNLELVNCIDQHLPTIEDGLETHFQPNLYEMLFGRKNSLKRLDIHVYHGDIAVPDDRLKADCFTMVEMIEHITPEHLVKVCRTVFGYYRPRFIIVTTPNVEFNPLLQAYSKAKLAQSQQSVDIQGVKSEPDPIKKFRHHDHKFEWTRAEFSQWATLMCQDYSYQVYFSGVGELPNSEPYGPCTQIALFKRQEINDLPRSVGIINDPTICFDLFLNKLSVQEDEPEFLGDPTLRKVCLRAKYHVPGTTAANSQESDCSVCWSDIKDEEMSPNNDWSSQQEEIEQTED